MKLTKIVTAGSNLTVKNTRVAIYVRVSTEEQKRDGFSIRSQIEKLSQYASIKDWVIRDIYDDKGISGKNIEERPNLKRMLEDIKNKKIDVVLVFKLDRLTRNIRDLMELTDIFNTYKCEFCSLTENIDTHTASGRMFLKILGIFAEFERENLIERVRYGFERKAKEGYTNARAVASYGYERSKGDKILSIKPAEAEVVNYVFRSFASDLKTTYEIAKELNAKGIKSKGNSVWTNSNIIRMLTNSTYIGKIRYSIGNKDLYEEFDGKHEPIISEELFKKAKTRIDNSKKTVKTKTPAEDAFFTGLLYCSGCGNKMTGHKNYRTLKNGLRSIYIQYRCFKRSAGYCHQPSINHRKLENAFLKYIEKLNASNKITADSALNLSVKKHTKTIQKLKIDIENLENKKKDIMQLFLTDALNFMDYKEMISVILQEIDKKSRLIFELSEEMDEEKPLLQEKFLIDIKNWKNFSNKERQEFLRAFIDRITVSSERIDSTTIVKIEQIVFSKHN